MNTCLVDVLVQEGAVQGPVAAVEHKVLNRHAHKYLHGNNVPLWHQRVEREAKVHGSLAMFK